MFYFNRDTKSTTRFDAARFSFYDVDIYDTLNSYLWAELPTLPTAGKFTVLSEQGRPDFISYAVYGTTSLWWVVMTYNGFMRPQDITSGIEVNYPSLLDLNTLYMRAPSLQTAKDLQL